MTSKRASPLFVRRTASSSSSEEEVSSEGEHLSSPPPAAEKKSQPKTVVSNLASSDTETEMESETESESEHSLPAQTADPNLKPLVEDIPKKKLATAGKSTTKRSRDNNFNREENNSKSVKKRVTDATANGAKKRVTDAATDGEVDATGNDGKKMVDDSKKLFQRLWSEDDEIAILKGMVEYSAKKGADPYKDMNAFHDFIKKSLHVDVSKTQLMDKIRRLKKKYENNAGKGIDGGDPNFSKPHEKKSYELSKKIWGTVGEAKSNGNQKEGGKTSASLKAELGLKEAVIDDNSDSMLSLSEMLRFEKSMGLSGLDEDVCKRGLKLVGSSKRVELEERWKSLQIDELELFVKRTELIKDQANMIWEAYKSSNH